MHASEAEIAEAARYEQVVRCTVESVFIIWEQQKIRNYTKVKELSTLL